MIELTIFLGTFIVTYFGVALLRRWMLRRGHVAIPNERSSHTVPTPTGAGLVLATAVMAALGLSCYLLDIHLPYVYFAAALVILIVSWLDDLNSVSFIVRFAIQIVAAVISVILIGGSDEQVNLGGGVIIGSAWLSKLIGALWIICLINSYNFMDGIDGIAGSQAIVAAIGYLIYGISTDAPVAMIFGGITAFAGLAFVFHNWPPARIFMGDSGSAFLGYSFAVVPLFLQDGSTPGDTFPLLAGLAFVWLFIFDVGLTSIRRTMHGQMLWTPSREHLYQRLVISGYSHRRVTIIYGLLGAIATAGGLAAIWSTTSQSLVIILLALAGTSSTLLLICWKRGVLWGMNSR